LEITGASVDNYDKLEAVIGIYPEFKED